MNANNKINRFKLYDYLNWKIYVVLILIMFSLSAYVRHHQYTNWRHHASLYFVQNYPAMTTLDAYYWLRYAKEYKNGTYQKSNIDKLRKYPEGTYRGRIPMISYLIAKTSKITGLSIYQSGLTLIPILASLFIIPLTLYFYLSKMPLGGIVGSFVGAFSWIYFVRTSMGRVDTDLLQLFFLFLASLFVLLMYQAKKYIFIVLNFILMLVTLKLFGWWYGHQAIIAVYGALALFLLFIKGLKDRNILYASAIILILSTVIGYGYLSGIIGFIHSYMFPKESVDYFPNILNTITETVHAPIKETLALILSSYIITGIGLLAFAASIIFLRISIIPLLPILALGFVAFTSSKRAAMFIAPFVGVGLGFVLDLFINYAKDKYSLKNTQIAASSTVLAGLLILSISSFSAIKFTPKPSIKPDIIHSFIEIKKKINSANIFSWWDYGYAIEDIDGYSTYHDGGVHGGARTYLIAKGLTDNNQQHLYNIVSYVDKNGTKNIYREIDKGKKPQKIVDEIMNYKKPLRTENDYLLFTRDMVMKFSAISYFGNWNFKTQKTKYMGYQSLRCSSFKNNILTCQGAIFDLKKGTINNKIPIKKVIYIQNGYQKNQQNFFEKGVTIEIITRNNILLNILLCNDAVFKSNFNQIYILGQYDKKYFEEIYNNFPSARMFKLKSDTKKQ